MTVQSEKTRPDLEQSMVMLSLKHMEAGDRISIAVGRILRDVGVPFGGYMQREVLERHTPEEMVERANAVCKLTSMMLMALVLEMPPNRRTSYGETLMAALTEYLRDDLQTAETRRLNAGEARTT